MQQPPTPSHECSANVQCAWEGSTLLWLLLFLLPTIQTTAHAQSHKLPPLASYFTGRRAAFILLDVKRHTYLRYNPQRAAERFSPCSTFKIPNSLIGLETGVIPDENYTIKWNGTQYPMAPWNHDHTLKTAFANSVVWYYQELARRVGEERMRHYVRAIHYGNEDISGGLTTFWLSRTLKISTNEQVDFLDRLIHNRLPFSRRSMNIVKRIMVISEKAGVTFRGKTGTAGDAEKQVAAMGWFVGYVTRPEGDYIFATNIEGGDNPSGKTAREITRRILMDRGLLSPWKEVRK